MPPQSRGALHHSFFSLLHIFCTWQSLVLSLEASSSLPPSLYVNLEKNQKNWRTCSQICFQLHQTCWRAGQTACPIPSLSMFAKAEIPINTYTPRKNKWTNKKTTKKTHQTKPNQTNVHFMVTCTSVQQSYHANMTLVRQILLQPLILNVWGENIPRRAIISNRCQLGPQLLKRPWIKCSEMQSPSSTRNVPSTSELMHGMLVLPEKQEKLNIHYFPFRMSK